MMDPRRKHPNLVTEAEVTAALSYQQLPDNTAGEYGSDTDMQCRLHTDWIDDGHLPERNLDADARDVLLVLRRFRTFSDSSGELILLMSSKISSENFKGYACICSPGVY